MGWGITPTTVEVLESLVAKRVVSFSLESGYKKLVIKGDSELMIGALRCGGWKNSHGGHLINDILFSINSFQSISFSHVVQQGNAVAHALAQRVRRSFPFLVWKEHVPPDVWSFVLSDFPHS